LPFFLLFFDPQGTTLCSLLGRLSFPSLPIAHCSQGLVHLLLTVSRQCRALLHTKCSSAASRPEVHTADICTSAAPCLHLSLSSLSKKPAIRDDKNTHGCGGLLLSPGHHISVGHRCMRNCPQARESLANHRSPGRPSSL
jgi:hypothetical protein